MNMFATLLFLFAPLSILATSFQLPSAMVGDVTWLSATPFDGANYADGMPAGNGRVVVLAWANTTIGSIDFYVRSPLAMHTDTQLYTLARISVAVSPNPFSSGAYFNQTIALSDGSITILMGGTSYNDYNKSLTLWVDANNDSVFVSAASRDGSTLFSLSTTINSVRPSSRFTYGPLDFQCQSSSSGPDIFADSLPAPAPAGSIAIFHVNDVASGDTSLFNSSMHIQGLTSLLGEFTDPLDGRIFGLAITGGSGEDGTGTPLSRISPSLLASASPASTFLVSIAILADPDAGGDTTKYLQDISTALVSGPSPSARKAASVAWWASFWLRSWIELPPSPPPPPRVGVFPCDGSASQNMKYNSATGEVRLPGNSCFSPNIDGTVVSSGACTMEQVWSVTPCTATGCNAGEFWVQNNADKRVLGLPGATCPWLDTWTVDDPTGDQKNELWYFNSTDSTLRTLCKSCSLQCVSAVQPSEGDVPSVLAAQYARTRFIHAVQSRGHSVPIKFNGMLFTSMTGNNGPKDIDYRQWGPNHWWQNTRLPYGAQLAAGDFDTMSVVLDWVSGMLPLIQARSQLLLGFGSFFMTETEDQFGLYQGYEYGCSAATERPPGYPIWLEGPGDEGGWVRYDFGGNGVGLEAGLMAIDYCIRTLDATACAKYVPIATFSLDFYIYHYKNLTSDGKFLIWPTQVLESYWCEWPGWNNCCENDLPQLSGVTSLVGALLDVLPTQYLTAEQRARYTNLRSILPGLPLTADGTQYAPAWVLSSGSHNAEVPELFASHPFRLNTVGRAFVDESVNLTISRTTWKALPLAQSNTGWYYGIMDASYLGLADEAFAMAIDRANQPPPAGYRFPAFAQHYQDYEPSADHYANMMTSLQLQLLQSGEDLAGTIIVFPAWDCSDVTFKLWGPQATSVSIVFKNQTLVSIDVEPPSRRSAVKFANCVAN